MKKQLPLVSIIIPVYNGSNYLRDAINSALSQTYGNFEVIVINDGSTDRGKTEAVAKSYGNKIRYYSKQNGGVASAFNYGLKKMKGEYFSWLSHDDLYDPNKVKTEIDFLNQNNLFDKKAIIYSDYHLVDKRKKIISTVHINHKLIEEKSIYCLLRGVLNGNSILIPKKAFEEYGPFDVNLSCTQDYDKWFEMSKTYRFYHIPKPLVSTRYHAKQTTNTSPKVSTEGNVLWLKMIKSFSPKQRKELNGSDYAFYYLLTEYLKNTPYDKAYEYCKEQLTKYPPENVSRENYVSFSMRPLSKNKIVKIFQLTHREGVKNMVKRINKKLKKIILKNN